MYFRNNEQDPINYESEKITAENGQDNRNKHTDKNYMGMPYHMSPMSSCPMMETCPMKDTCPMMGQYNMMAQMDPPGDPDPRFNDGFHHHIHHHFHHHFFHPFVPHMHHHGY